MRVILFLFAILYLLDCEAQLQLAQQFTDNMVLQRNKPIQIFGKGMPGKNVTVKFANLESRSIVKRDSTWAVVFRSQKENNSGQSVIIQSADEKIILQNILIGDVWLCIGQSNMEWPVKSEMHYSKQTDYTNNSIRFYNPTYTGKGVYGTRYNDSLINLISQRTLFAPTNWAVCNNTSVRDMSAVAYYFASSVNRETAVPIGMINFSIGGAPLETFIDQSTLKQSAVSTKINGNWLYNNSLPVWIRERGMQNVGGLQDIPSDEYGPHHAYKPGYAFRDIQQFTGLPICGILNYQGESNAQEIESVDEYAALQQLLVTDYRKKWKDKKLPFYFAQLSSIDTLKYKGQLWGTFRNEQRIANSLINYSGMAVTSDIGNPDDVHPTNKKDVGERLARWALYQTYNKKFTPSGPLPINAKFEKGKVKIFFKYAANGLKISNGEKLQGFSFDGKEEVEATSKENFVEIITSKRPEFIYYGWRSFSNGNLVNSVDLPASTFKLKID